MLGKLRIWLRALLHAAVLAVGVGLLGALLAGLKVFPHPDRVAETTGGLVLWLFLVALFASAALQSGHKLIGTGLAAIGASYVVVIVVAWILGALWRPDRPVALTSAEKADFRLAAQGALYCNAPLGFSFPALSMEFSPVPDLQRRINARSSAQKTFAWAFQNRNIGESVVVEATKGLGRHEASLRGFAKGVSVGLARSSRVARKSDYLTWSLASGEYRVSIQRTDGTAVDLQCLATASSGHNPPLIVCIQTASSRSENLEIYRRGLALNGC